MEYRYLGMTGLRVSSICLGTMTFGGVGSRDSKGRPGQSDEELSKKILDRYVELGGNFIDTADIYPASGEPNNFGHSEEIIGNWLKDIRWAEWIAHSVFLIECESIGHGGNLSRVALSLVTLVLSVVFLVCFSFSRSCSIPRESLIIATKCGFGTRRDQFVRSNGGGLTRNHILWSIDQSLLRLKTNYIDLYQVHCWDNATPIEGS